MQQVYSKCVERYGIIEANVLIGTGALWNGCHFCPRSHLWIANLYYLRDTGKLFPLDDTEASQLQKLTDAEALEVITQKLTQGGFADLARRVERQYHLKVGDHTGTTEDDPSCWLPSPPGTGWPSAPSWSKRKTTSIPPTPSPAIVRCVIDIFRLGVVRGRVHRSAAVTAGW